MSVIDFHCHILPRVDDGSKSLEQSLNMLRRESEQGVETVVLTPHFYANHCTMDQFLHRRQAAFEALRMAASADETLPGLVLGAEVKVFEGLSQIDELEKLTVAGTRCILVEFPMLPWSDWMFRELRKIRADRKLTPIFAHVDRYMTPWRSFGIPEKLEQLPVLVQANAEFFLRRATRKRALKMLQAGQIHLLGSDCHDLEERCPNLGPAKALIARQLGQQALTGIAGWEQQIMTGLLPL